MLLALAVATVIASPFAERIDPKAVDVAVRCACQTHPNKDRCSEDRREEIAEAVEDLVAITDEFDLPKSMRPILVAVACGESGFHDRPTCGGRKHCNDRGTSGGMFQFKLRGGLAKRFERENGRPLDVHDRVEAGRYYLRLLVEGKALLSKRCGRVDDPWNVAAYRLGRGPYVVPPKKGYKACALDPTPSSIFSPLVCADVPPYPGVKRCLPGSKYARWARKWSEGAVWTLRRDQARR